MQHILHVLRARYRRARKKERSAILDEYVRTTGCHCKHAIAVLRGKRKRGERPIRRPRRARYGCGRGASLAEAVGAV